MSNLQGIFCKCGSCIAACREPECYEDRDWHTSLRRYSKKGYAVKLISSDSVTLEKCKCNKNNELFNKTE